MHKRDVVLALFIAALLFPFEAFAATSYGRLICHSPGLMCLHVKRGQSWSKLWPDVHDRDIVMRVNRMNTELYPGLTIAVPLDVENRNVMDFAPFLKQIQAPGEKLVVVDPAVRAWGAYDDNGTLLRWGPISAGADYCPDIQAPCRTHAGSYRIFSLGSSDCYSTKFPLPDGGAPMPYCMYFNNGQALHGEPNGLPGYNASHGCVRMYVNDAEWLRYDFVEGPSANNNYRGTKVILQPYEAEAEDN